MKYLQTLSLLMLALTACLSYHVAAQMPRSLAERLAQEDVSLSPLLQNADPSLTPLLLKAICARSEVLRYAALCGLEKVAAKEESAVIFSLLSDTSPRIRRRAIMLLTQWRNDDSVAAVQKKLQDSDKLVRAAAIWALGELAAAVNQQSLTAALHDEAWEVRCAAWAALAHLPLDIPDSLRTALGDPIWQVRCTAIEWAVKVKADFAPVVLREFLAGNEQNEQVLAAAVDALAVFGDTRSLPFLLSGLHHKYDKVRGACDRAITRLAPACLDKLIAVWQDRQTPAEVRHQVGLVFGRIRAKTALPHIYSLACNKEETGELRYIALILVADLDGEKAVSVLREYLAADDIWVRRGAIAGVGQLRDAQSLPVLWSMLEKANEALREELLWAVAQMPAEAVAPMVLAALASDHCDDMRLLAIRLSGILRIREAGEKLRHLAADARWQEPARWALRQLAGSH
jgi:HEAT repeat protein